MQNVLQSVGVPPLRLLRRLWYTWLCTRPLLESVCSRAMVTGCGWVFGGLRPSRHACSCRSGGPGFAVPGRCSGW